MPSLFSLWTVGLVAAIGYGLSIGSFLNVVIYRLPRGESVAKPTWSYCPNCRHRLSTRDLVPLFSFLVLGRKCRYCRQPISWRYFGIEALTAVLFTLVYLKDGWGFDVVFDALFISLLIPIFFIDLEQFIIPNELSVLGFALGIAHNLYGIWQGHVGMWMRVLGTRGHIPASLGAAIIGASLFHAISFVGLIYYARAAQSDGRSLGTPIARYLGGIVDDYAYLALKYLGFGLWLASARQFIAERDALEAEDGESEADEALGKTRAEIAEEIEADDDQTGMGQGDAKLAGMIGANLLLSLSLLSFFLAVLAGTIVGVGMMILQRRSGRTAIPFGPFMVIGAVAALLIGHPLLNWYWHFLAPVQ